MRKLKLAILSLILLAVLGMLALQYVATRGLVGGKSSTSPDGKYELNISRLLDARPTDPYRINVRNMHSDNLVVKIDFTPVAGLPNPPVRGPQTEIRWVADSKHADIIFDNMVVCTIYVPE